MTNKNLGSTIIELSNQGLSYNQIRDKLNCSKGTISYHLGNGQKYKYKLRSIKNRKNLHPYINKINHFCDNRIRFKSRKMQSLATYVLAINRKISDFCRNTIVGENMTKKQFTVQDVINKFGDNPKCALTGLPIDVNKPSTYQFDHIIPRTRGGDNSLDNLQLVTKHANYAKHNMTQDEFINLCKLVLENHNFSVTKN